MEDFRIVCERRHNNNNAGCKYRLNRGIYPYGDDYERPVIVLNTMRIDDIHIINDGKQIIGLTGSTLYNLEKN